MYTLCQNNQLTMARTYRLSTILGAKKQKRYCGLSLQVVYDHVILLLTIEELSYDIWIYFHLRKIRPHVRQEQFSCRRRRLSKSIIIFCGTQTVWHGRRKNTTLKGPWRDGGQLGRETRLGAPTIEFCWTRTLQLTTSRERWRHHCSRRSCYLEGERFSAMHDVQQTVSKWGIADC